MSWLTRGSTVIYVRIRRNWMAVRIVERGQTAKQYENSTAVMIQSDRAGTKKVVAVGQEANLFTPRTDLEQKNAFDHPRIVIDDLELASTTLAYFLQRVVDRWLFIAPRVIVHSLRDLDGGLSAVERQVLLNLAMLAGGREVFLFEERRELSDNELLTIKPSDFQNKWKS